MYTLKITNDFRDPVSVAGGGQINPGQSDELKDLGNATINVPGIGDARLFDLGDKKLPGFDYPKETWGVLLRYQTMEAYFRYEGGGQLSIEIGEFGTLTVSSSNGTVTTIKLPEVIVEGEGEE